LQLNEPQPRPEIYRLTALDLNKMYGPTFTRDGSNRTPLYWLASLAGLPPPYASTTPTRVSSKRFAITARL
jgi:hypothetical protein